VLFPSRSLPFKGRDRVGMGLAQADLKSVD
jgi:hypothetical protein